MALHLAFAGLVEKEELTAIPLTDSVAAISCGIHSGQTILDLEYIEDSTAQADANFVLTGSGGIVEVQGTAETEPFSREQLNELQDLAHQGVEALTKMQNEAIKAG